MVSAVIFPVERPGAHSSTASALIVMERGQCLHSVDTKAQVGPSVTRMDVSG